MLDSYRQVLSRPGALAFSSAALVARLPMSMVGLGIVLLVEERTGSYGLAGIAGFVVDHRGASAAYGVALVGGVLAAVVAQTARRSPSVPA